MAASPLPAQFARVAVMAGLTWSIWAPPAAAYIDPTAAGAFLQSLYIAMASALLFVAALPHKVAAFVRSVKARFAGKPPEPSAPAAAAPESEPPESPAA